MRKEDKMQLPQTLKPKLPPGYHVERRPRVYLLYFSYPCGAGRMTDLVAAFDADTLAGEIEQCAVGNKLERG